MSRWQAVFFHFALASIVALSATLATMFLTTGHDWGDDFAAYIGQAQSVAQGHPASFVEANRFTAEKSTGPFGPVAYPWGYPLLLAPFYAVFGLKLLGLKSLTVVCWVLALYAFAGLLATRLTPLYRLAAVALVAGNLQFLQLMDQLLSDIPFLWVSLLGLWLIDRFVVRQRFWRNRACSYALLAVVLWFAAITRSNGLLLVPVLALCQIVEAVRGPRAEGRGQVLGRCAIGLLPYGLFAALYGISLYLLPDGGNSHLAQLRVSTGALVWSNSLYYMDLPATLFLTPPSYTLYGAAVALFCIGVLAGLKRDYHLVAFFALTVTLYLVWPHLQGIRFLFPILPLFFYFLVQGLTTAAAGMAALCDTKWVAKVRLPQILLFVLAANCFYAATVPAQANVRNGRKQGGPFDAVSTEMFDYVRTQTPPTAVIAFFKPRILRLLTNRPAYGAWAPADLAAADIIVIHKGMGTYNQLPHPERVRPLVQVFSNREYIIYRKPVPASSSRPAPQNAP